MPQGKFSIADIDQPTAPAAGTGQFRLEDVDPIGPVGAIEPGNIDLARRPRVQNPDGTVSTVRSMSFDDHGREVLIPTVSDDGRVLSDADAIATYRRTGKHLGIFRSPAEATAYAEQLHDDYAAGKYPKPPALHVDDSVQPTRVTPGGADTQRSVAPLPPRDTTAGYLVPGSVRVTDPATPQAIPASPQPVARPPVHVDDAVQPTAATPPTPPLIQTPPNQAVPISQPLPPPMPAGPRSLSPEGAELLKVREGGFYGSAYQDSNGGPAVGYGMHTFEGRPVTLATRTTLAAADADFDRQVRETYEPAFMDVLTVPITQHQHDALVSVAWNSPAAAANLARKLNAGVQPTLKDFLASGTEGGKPHPGLQARRRDEFAQFVTPDSPEVVADATSFSSGPAALAAPALASGAQAFSPAELDVIGRSAPVQQSQSVDTIPAAPPSPDPQLPPPGRLASAKTGGAAVNPPIGQGFIPGEGGPAQIARGATVLAGQLAHPPVVADQPHVVAGSPPAEDAATKNAISDVIEGAFRTGSPLVAAALLTNPVVTVVGLGIAGGAQQAAEKAVRHLGGTEEDARLAGNLAAAATAAGATDVLVRGARAKLAAAGAEARASMAARAEAAEAARTITPDANVIDILPKRDALPEAGRAPAPIEGRAVEAPPSPAPGATEPPVSIEPSPGVSTLPQAAPPQANAASPQLQAPSSTGQFSPADIDATVPPGKESVPPSPETVPPSTKNVPPSPEPLDFEAGKNKQVNNALTQGMADLTDEEIEDLDSFDDFGNKLSLADRGLPEPPSVERGTFPPTITDALLETMEEAGGADMIGAQVMREHDALVEHLVKRGEKPPTFDAFEGPRVAQYEAAFAELKKKRQAALDRERGTFTAEDVDEPSSLQEPDSEAAPREFASTQIALPPDVGAKLQTLGARIPDEQLAADGRETDPHVTLKYGLHGNDPAAVRALLADEPPITVTLGKTSIFPNGESNSGDVVKVDVDSPDLHRLNKKIADALETTDTFPDYQPHATIAYVKPGQGHQYAGDASLEGETFTVDRITFTGTHDERIEIPLGGTSSPAPADTAPTTRLAPRPDTAATTRLPKTKRPPRGARSPEVEWTALDRPHQREVRRILVEMNEFGYTGKSFTETTRRGGDLEVKGGAAGAPVYWDIVGGDRERAVPTFSYSRAEVVAKLRLFVEKGKRSVVSDLAVDVAQRRIAGDSSLSAPTFPRDAGFETGAVRVPRLRNLPPEQAAIQERLARLVEDDTDALAVQYRERFGNVVSADSAKELFPDYQTKDQRAANDLAVHRPASRLAQYVYDQILSEPVPDGQSPFVMFTSGGTGSGKSTSLDVFFSEMKADAHAVYDSTLTDLDAAVRNIEAARAVTHAVAVIFTDRDVMEAYRATRVRQAAHGRPVTVNTHVLTHLRAPEVFQALREKYEDLDTAPYVDFFVVRNSNALGRELVPLADWQPPRYNEGDVRREIAAVHPTDSATEPADVPRGIGGPPDADPDGRRERREEVPTRTVPGRDAARDAARSSTDVVDTLDTGEQQRRLPEAGPVREQDVPTPTFDAPYTLDGGADTTPKEHAQTLFDTAKTRPSGSGGGGRESMAGLFTDAVPVPAVGTVRPPQLVEFPELVALARELAQTPSVVKAFRSAGKRGDFNTVTGAIRLTAELFKAGNERQLAATLAHEIGHLVDWLPHRTLKRGNILGRLFSLRAFLKHTFVAPDGSQITQKDIRAELTALSNTWRPWDPSTASPSFAAYRKSSKEIFADAISVLLNDPGLLQKDAPIFYEQFFTALDNKPEVKRAYFDLQELLSGTPEELIARRRAGVRDMFTLGDTTAMDLERLHQAERTASRTDLWLRARIQFVDKNTPIIDRVKALEAQGVRINPDDDPRYFLEERNYLGGKLKAFTERHFQPIYETLLAHDVDWSTFGEMLFYERIASGDRSELANPRGITPAAATDLAAATMRQLTPAQRTVVRDSLTAFRTAVRGVAGEAHDAGLYTDALHEQIQQNPAYAAFRVIDHLDEHVTSRVHRQIGTLKDVTNPADASMLKTLVTIRATEQQKLKVATFEFLTEHYPGDIAQAKEIGSAKGPRPIEPKDREKQRLVTYYEKGKLRGKYVDPYIAESLTNASVGQNLAVVQALRWINSGVFRPVFTTLNLGFQTFNAGRDFLRFWKNTPTMTLTRAVKRYGQALPMARVRAFGLPEAPTFAQRQAAKDLQQAGDAQILSVTFNDLIDGRTVEDTQIEDTLSKLGIGGFGAPPRTGVAKLLGPVLDWIKASGDFIETLPKAAAMHEFRGRGTIAELPADTRSFIRRKVGSPDFLAGGTWKPVTNEVFLFSNAIVQAIRADAEVATGPTTRAGFWWKTAAMNVVPKLIAFVLLASAFLDDDDKEGRLARLRRIYQGMSEYDLTNYNNVPLGLDAKGNAVYLRVPQDDFGRLIGGLVWKALHLARGDRDVMKTAMQVFDYMAGQAPTVTPVFEAASDVAQIASGQNVHDSFRNRFLFTDDELKAGGWQKAKKFLGYEFQQLGGGIVWKFYAGEPRPRERTPGQTILDFPIVSNIVGRWIKVTNFGEVERLRDAQGDVQQGEARTRLRERSAVNDALRTYQALPGGEQTPAKQAALARAIVSDLYPKDQWAEQFRDVLKKIRMGIVRGDADALTDTVMSATSTAQKAGVILKAAESMSASEFQTWLRQAAQERVVSASVWAEVRKARRATPTTRPDDHPTPP